MYHDLHGASFHTLTAADTLFLVDHVNAGLGILSNGLMLASLHALAALDAHHGLCTSTLGGDLDAAQVRMELLVECLGASTDTLQTSHAFHIFLNSKLFHNGGFSFVFYFLFIIQQQSKNSNG